MFFHPIGNEMPNVSATLRAEIVKLARKELSSQVRRVKKVSADNRRNIAALKRMVTELQPGKSVMRQDR